MKKLLVISLLLIGQDGASPNGGFGLLGGSGGGTPTSPGGSSGQVQFNNAGSFGGFGSWNGTTLAVDQLEVVVTGFFDSQLNMGAGASLGFSDGVDFGGALKRVTGGSGGLKVTDGSTGFQELQAQDFRLIPNGVARPTCDSAHRGTIWYESSGAGVPDTMSVCAKPTTDVFAWIAMAVIP